VARHSGMRGTDKLLGGDFGRGSHGQELNSHRVLLKKYRFVEATRLSRGNTLSFLQPSRAEKIWLFSEFSECLTALKTEIVSECIHSDARP
jgi:hypothetical protein